MLQQQSLIAKSNFDSGEPKRTDLLRTCQVLTIITMIGGVLGAYVRMTHINDIEPILFLVVPVNLVLQAGLFVVFGKVIRIRQTRA